MSFPFHVFSSKKIPNDTDKKTNVDSQTFKFTEQNNQKIAKILLTFTEYENVKDFLLEYSDFFGEMNLHMVIFITSIFMTLNHDYLELSMENLKSKIDDPIHKNIKQYMFPKNSISESHLQLFYVECNIYRIKLAEIYYGPAK